jgi:hypothetical protein
MKSIIKKIQINFMCASALIMAVISIPPAKTPIPLPDDCIGNICIYHNEFFEIEILFKYGKGKESAISIGKRIKKRSHCYYDPYRKIWVRIEASGNGTYQFVIKTIYVSSVPFCRDTIYPRNKFGEMNIRNIKIGSKESFVLSVFGKPDRTDTIAGVKDAGSLLVDTLPGTHPKFGSKRLFYSPEGENSLLSYAFYTENGFVKSIEISCSE